MVRLCWIPSCWHTWAHREEVNCRPRSEVSWPGTPKRATQEVPVSIACSGEGADEVHVHVQEPL